LESYSTRCLGSFNLFVFSCIKSKNAQKLQTRTCFSLTNINPKILAIFNLGKKYAESLKRIISTSMNFTMEICNVVNLECPAGKEIIHQCVKTIKSSFGIMDIDNLAEYKEKFNIFFQKVSVIYFSRNWYK
jgi:hypothetical protein